MGNWLGDFGFKWAISAVSVSFILMTILVLLVFILVTLYFCPLPSPWSIFLIFEIYDFLIHFIIAVFSNLIVLCPMKMDWFFEVCYIA